MIARNRSGDAICGLLVWPVAVDGRNEANGLDSKRIRLTVWCAVMTRHSDSRTRFEVPEVQEIQNLRNREPSRLRRRIAEMPRFTIRTLLIATAGLMAYVTYLSRFPVAILISLSVPALCALLFLPYLGLRLVVVLRDTEEPAINTAQLHNCLWTIFFCLVALAPIISLLATAGFDYLLLFVLKSHNT